MKIRVCSSVFLLGIWGVAFFSQGSAAWHILLVASAALSVSALVKSKSTRATDAVTVRTPTSVDVGDETTDRYNRRFGGLGDYDTYNERGPYYSDKGTGGYYNRFPRS
jgi:hypothetical protein